MHKGKATCLNMNDNDSKWIERILCPGDMDSQIAFVKIYQALYKNA